MIKGIKIKLKSNTKLFESAGVARFAYNWTLNRQIENYKNGGKFISDNELRKEFTKLKQIEEYNWLNNYSNNITKQAIKDACDAHIKFFKGESKYPRFKSRKRSKPSFYVDTDRIQFNGTHVKLENQLKKLNQRLTNIRHNYSHQTTTEIIKRKPSFIVVEDLNVSGMMKNKHLSKAIQEQRFYEIYRQIQYKSERNNIKLIVADRYFQSSKTCSQCGSYNKDLKLGNRKYIYECCGSVLDRDYNASLNLKNYGQEVA